LVVRYGSPEWRRQKELEQEAKKRTVEQAKERYLEQKRQREQERARERSRYERDLVRRAEAGHWSAIRQILHVYESEQEKIVAADESAAEYHGLASLLEERADSREVPGWYLRLGEPPESGRSRSADLHSINGVEEGGVSVFGGRMLVGGSFVLDLGTRELRHSAWLFFGQQDREAFFVRGIFEGRGGDGEPVLGRIKEIVPVPREAIIASRPASVSIERWNERRGGPLVDRVPGLAAWEDD